MNLDQRAGHQAAEAAARQSYGRLLAWLCRQWRDVQAAEDALADAFVSALTHWPHTGVPDAPEAWLLSAAKQRLREGFRHAKVVERHAEGELQESEELRFASADPPPDSLPDRRLELMLACTHPAIDPSLHVALMLQVVLGLEAEVIASAYLLSPAALAQRLVRAKRKLREAGIAFDLSDAAVLPDRVNSVLEAIYAGYGRVHDAGPGADDSISALRSEVLFLAELVGALLPDCAEALGLHALLLYCEARRDPGEAPDAAFVPLHERDATVWDRARMQAAERLLWRAASLRQPGPFQLEAAIQSAHCQRAFTGVVPWRAIAALYAQLMAISPTVGACIGHAVALMQTGDSAHALIQLQSIDPQKIINYQPYWIAMANVYATGGAFPLARACFERGIGLTERQSLRRFLQDCRMSLPAN